jgi:archaellum component FlaC
MEAKRDREAKQAELEEKKIDQQSSQHIDCKTARDQIEYKVASVESQVSGLSVRVNELASKVEHQGSLAVGGDDLAERVGKIEKAIKALKKVKS